MERNITKLQAGQEGEILLLVQEVEKALDKLKQAEKTSGYLTPSSLRRVALVGRRKRCNGIQLERTFRSSIACCHLCKNTHKIGKRNEQL